MDDLVRITKLNRGGVHTGIAFIRDNYPGCLIVEKNGSFQHYKFATEGYEM